MSYKTLEVELENGRVRPCGSEELPLSGRALLTLLEAGTLPTVSTCSQLAEHWSQLDRLSLEEGNAFANDIEQSRSGLPPINSKWD